MEKNITVELLQKGQDAIEDRIFKYAKDQGLSNENILPITDGIYSAEKYLGSSPKVMWVLKEPYDENEFGKPWGGGWSIPKDCYDKNDAWTNRTWQPIIYSMYGLFNKLKWEKMDWIRDNKEMADVLKQIAYINISKMPAHTNSSQSPIENYYQIWKPILWEQIELYNPQVIIFGATFDYFFKDFFGSNNVVPEKQYIHGDITYISEYKKDGRILLKTFHPIAHQKGFNREYYVNSIISSINELI